MRGASWLAVWIVALPVAFAGHAVYVDETRVIGCLALVQASGVGAMLNCPGIDRSVNAAEAPGGQYRLTVDWIPVGAEWGQLRADLVSCLEACQFGGTGVCVNNNCVGDPGGGNFVQQASRVSASPLVVTIPTAGGEAVVQFRLNLPGPVATSLAGQSVHYVLDHVG